MTLHNGKPYWDACSIFISTCGEFLKTKKKQNSNSEFDLNFLQQSIWKLLVLQKFEELSNKLKFIKKINQKCYLNILLKNSLAVIPQKKTLASTRNPITDLLEIPSISFQGTENTSMVCILASEGIR